MDLSIQTVVEVQTKTQIFAKVCRFMNLNDSIQMYSA